jgi:hypothetical protein
MKFGCIGAGVVAQPHSRHVLQGGFAAVDLRSLAIGARLQQLGGPLAALNLTLVDRYAL